VTDATIARTGPDHRAALRASTFADVLRSEWVKLRSVRSTFWALTTTVVLGIALGAVISAVTAHAYARFSVAAKLSWDPTGVSQSGVAIAQVAIAVLGVLFISSEYSSGMIRTSLIAVPKRGRVLAAKSLVFAGVTVVVGEVVCFVAFFVGQALISGALISGHAPHAALGDPGVARAVAGGALYLAALAVLSVAAGALLRHAAAAITCMIAVLFVLPGIAQALPDSWRNPVNEFWPTQAGSQLTSVYHSAHTLQPWPGFGVMCLFVAIVYAIAWTLLDRRDA
jgi:ABC-2 type transport system permease protein